MKASLYLNNHYWKEDGIHNAKVSTMNAQYGWIHNTPWRADEWLKLDLLPFWTRLENVNENPFRE